MTKQRATLLLVDDTPANIQVLHEVFQGEYDMFFATSGAEGVEIARRELPDLILMDVMMPGMDGYAACAILKGDPLTAEIPIIFVTALGEEEDETRGLDAGAIDYLTKPICPPIVRARVRNHLELKRNRDLLARVGRELEERNATLEKERALAHNLLSSILPQHLDIPGFSTAVRFIPSDQIGGDFFDAWYEGGRAHFLIGDISGHSISAALLMAVCKGLFITIGKGGGDPGEIVTSANRILCDMVVESGMYLTMVYAICDQRAGTLRAVSAGHNPAYLYTAAGRVELVSTGPPIGWWPDASWDVMEHPFSPGDRLLLYTDGLVEIRAPEGVLCGEDLFAGLSASAAPEEMVESLLARAESLYNGRFDDDVTVFAIGCEDYREP
jgi:sigma-B regulation protein RsbU (phosphoserine phosphatase)